MGSRGLEEWLRKVEADLAQLSEQDFGYPLGQNQVRPPGATDKRGLPEALAGLYSVCDGLSLPDVWNGYFIDSAERVLSATQRGEPSMVKTVDGTSIPICVFGSDGGGGRFALGLNDSAVYHLPSAGAVRGGLYEEHTVSKLRKLADHVAGFLWLLERDVSAFARDDRAHSYLT